MEHVSSSLIWERRASTIAVFRLFRCFVVRRTLTALRFSLYLGTDEYWGQSEAKPLACETFFQLMWNGKLLFADLGRGGQAHTLCMRHTGHLLRSWRWRGAPCHPSLGLLDGFPHLEEKKADLPLNYSFIQAPGTALGPPHQDRTPRRYTSL